MYKKKICISLITLFILKIGYSQEIPIIPLPNHYEKVNQTFTISNRTGITVKDSAFFSAAYYFKNELLNYTGIPMQSGRSKGNVILLQRQNITDHKEGSYHIAMTADNVMISAADEKGIFNGVVSLLQLALHTKNEHNALQIPCWNITDSPLYPWRGLMLDESRHFFGKKTVEMLLDWMAFYKLNYFHWHLTDAPGWRIQIKKYPLLTLIGGIGNYSDSLAPAKYYTQDDIRAIVAYAKARHITVIPEIDMPGHATAANRAYPQFSGGGTGRFADFTFNPGKNGTYHYLTNILREVAVLFPSEMIHLGGDEVSFGSKSWAEDTGVQHLMMREHLTDLKALEHYFFRRMDDSALTLFHKVLAWDEAADATLPADSTIIFWWRQDKPEQLKKAFEKGYQVVLCPRIPLYFDFVQDSADRDGRRWKGTFSSLEKVYAFSNNTYPAAMQNNNLILGIQAALWTETVRSKKRLEYLLFPRIAALAEAAWTDTGHRIYKQFLSRLKDQLVLYRKEDIYFYNPFNPEETPEVVDAY